jgi:hypothetical protein
MAKFNKERLIFGIFLLVLIIIIDLIFHHLNLPNWPAFMIMIFFFEAHMDVKKTSHIIVGGAVGILCLVLTGLFVDAFSSHIGFMTSRLTIICLLVYAIVAFGEILPVIFNNYAFMFYLISGLASAITDPAPNPWVWIGIDLVAGILVILGIIGIGKLTAVLLRPGEQP